MPDELKYHISVAKMQQAYFNWCQIPMIETGKSWAVFWQYIGDTKHRTEGGWMLTETGARHVDYLLGPYAETMIRIWFKVSKPTPRQEPL